MSQPEMQPEGLPRPEGARKQGDLLGRPFPHGDWGEPAERLDEVYQWVEEGALRVAEWYLADRLWKRRTAQGLRVGAAAGAVVGAALPLLDLAGVLGRGAGWGAFALLLAVACAGADRYFGLTSGWMRDMATAQAVQRRLETLQFDWASESVREVLGPTEGTASEAVERCLTVLRRFCEDVSELVRTETSGWMVDFGSGPAPLFSQALVVQGPRPDSGSPASRFPLPPSTRPNMPRQRPPEPPR
ncbi:SLATT domain-containing protein [Streptomyces cucumeris]|uniref:SLATT domain-containing protein n=1 Tax=Streptomyces cucumeris TaxID=2962890 RepID=UPI0020C89708|nr:SLATT domain-containing protein [Streptomyces sp. NEAU-Y11]MCP9209232.1 SLATT domain-containing protein [Streptomyces sp. NEAU-Y11]